VLLQYPSDDGTPAPGVPPRPDYPDADGTPTPGVPLRLGYSPLRPRFKLEFDLPSSTRLHHRQDFSTDNPPSPRYW
jgi:hypothetical protein